MSRKRLVSPQLNPLLTDLPAKFTHIHGYQRDAITRILEHFDTGERVVVVDAPTGSGKTLIAEVVRLMLETTGSYVCHSKALQDQFSEEFGWPVLYGKANYLPLDAGRFVMDVTCEDCEGEECVLCGGGKCPYQTARDEALFSPVAVVNSALWLSSLHNPKHWLARRGLTVFDEADTLEGALLSQAEIVVSPWAQRAYGIEPPEKMTKDESYQAWAEATLVRLRDVRSGMRVEAGDIRATRARKRVENLARNVQLLADDLAVGRPWVYTGGAGSDRRQGEVVSFKPVKVDGFGKSRIWTHSPRFLLMSGTVVSAGMMLRGLGWDGGYGEVRVESQFHAKNRPVVVRPRADMSRASQSELGLRKVLEEVERIAADHAGDRILVHTVSYQLARTVEAGLGSKVDRPVFTYDSSSAKNVGLTKFLGTPDAVLVAPSLDRGVDLYDDRCRAQIILKLPFLSLADRQVSERLHKDPDGEVWYNVEVARTLMQMVGRGVRNANDYCTTYILDSHYRKWAEGWRHLFPKWFAKAIRLDLR